MDQVPLADFLRRRREALQPEDVGLPRGNRRRAVGLRREEVAALCHMSVDYYSRLEQARGPHPSEQMLDSIAQGLRLSLNERDHLYHLAGHNAPSRTLDSTLVAPGLMRVIDRLQDTPAQIMTSLGETLVQTPPARALFGDETRFTGLARSIAYRWFTDPATRNVYPSDDHDTISRNFAADVRAVHTRLGPLTPSRAIVDALLQESPEFAALWGTHEIRSSSEQDKRLQHPAVGVMMLQCHVLHDLDNNLSLLVITASPGTEAHEKLQRLVAISNGSEPAS